MLKEQEEQIKTVVSHSKKAREEIKCLREMPKEQEARDEAELETDDDWFCADAWKRDSYDGTWKST